MNSRSKVRRFSFVFMCILSMFFLFYSLKFYDIMDFNKVKTQVITTCGGIGIVSLKPETINNCLVRNATKTKVADVVSSYSKLCKSLDGYTKLTSCIDSTIELIRIENQDVHVKLSTYYAKEKPQSKGGDVLLLLAESVNGDKTTGEITDNANGTYTGVIRLFWTAETVIKVKLVGTLENACLKQDGRELIGDSMLLIANPSPIKGKYTFVGKNKIEETTLCSSAPKIHGYTEICNYTSINDNLHWYCGKPGNRDLGCSHITEFVRVDVRFPKDIIPHPEVFKRHCIFSKSIRVRIDKRSGPVARRRCFQYPLDTWTKSPSGYWSSETNSWQMTKCLGMTNHTVPQYRNCLRNKTIIFMGDSTVRQYVEYFFKFILETKIYDFYPCTTTDGTFQDRTFISNFNISIAYRRHAMPFFNKACPPKGIYSFSREIQAIGNWTLPGKNIIVLICYYVHFLPYPVEEFETRVILTARAIKRLIQEKPGITIAVKGPHVFAEDNFPHDSHLAILFMDILAREFHDIREHVIYLDVWAVTSAHDSHVVHPGGKALESQIQQFMSNICDTD